MTVVLADEEEQFVKDLAYSELTRLNTDVSEFLLKNRKDDDEENCCIERSGYCFDNTNEEEDYQNNLCIDSDRLLTTDRTLRIDGATDEEKFRICCEEVTNRCTGNTDSTNYIICTSEQNPNGPQNNHFWDPFWLLLGHIWFQDDCNVMS